jgi:DNA-directed RNA polymerase subunit RPC12/RpoP
MDTAKELLILQAPYGSVQKNSYPHERRFRMLEDIERRLRGGDMKLDDAEIGHLLDERDRFQNHYLGSLSKKDYFRLLTMFDFIDDQRYVILTHLFHETLQKNGHAYVCPNCKYLFLHAVEMPFPCSHCRFRLNPRSPTHLHCEFRFTRDLLHYRIAR